MQAKTSVFTCFGVVWTTCRLTTNFQFFSFTRQTTHYVGRLWQTTLHIKLRVVVVVVVSVVAYGN